MWLVWLLLGGFLGFTTAALVAAAARGDLAAEVQRLRRLEDDLHRLDLRVHVPAGDLFRARLLDVVAMWSWAADDGRQVILHPQDNAGHVLVAIDEIGDPIK